MIDLYNYLATMPFIQSIYIYNPMVKRYNIAAQQGQSGLIAEETLNDKNIIDILGNYKEYRPFTPIPRVLETQTDGSQGTGVYTYLCYDAISFDRRINSAVVVNITASWVNRELGSSEIATSGRTFLVDDHDRVRTVNELTDVALSPDDLLVFKNAIRHHQSGYLVTDSGNVNSLVTYTVPNQYTWHYVRITPYEDITRKLSGIRAKTFQIAAAVLIIGFLLAWLLSRFLYVPIHRIENRMEDLESERRDSSYTVRQNMLRKLIQIQDFDPEYQVERCGCKKWGFPLILRSPTASPMCV